MDTLNARIGLLAIVSFTCIAGPSCESTDDATPVDAGTDEPKTVTSRPWW